LVASDIEKGTYVGLRTQEEMLVLVDKDGSLQPAKVIGPTLLLTPGQLPRITGWKLHVGPSALDYSTTADKIYPRK
jgi:hypothetical protein